MPLLVFVLALPLLLLAFMPLLLVQRYRVATARRQVRPWLVTVNLALVALSVLFFLIGAAVTSIWVPRAFTGATAGLAVGAGLGVLGLLLTRWEPTPATLHYTPNRWLVLAVTVVVAARVVLGVWRSGQAAMAGVSGTSVVLAFGIPESLAAGGVALGYSVLYATGVRSRLSRWQRRLLRRHS